MVQILNTMVHLKYPILETWCCHKHTNQLPPSRLKFDTKLRKAFPNNLAGQLCTHVGFWTYEIWVFAYIARHGQIVSCASMRGQNLLVSPTVIIFLDLKCPRDRQVRSEFRHSTGVDYPFFNNVRFDFVTLFAQLWLNVFCLRSQNELKNFHSALQISQ